MLHSIVTALLEACNIDIGNVNTVAFLDLKKTFDTVSHDILLSKYVFIVYHGHVTRKCFSSYLDNHTQKRLVNVVPFQNVAPLSVVFPKEQH